MLKKNFLILGTMSLLLSSTLFANEIVPCEHCFADLSSLTTPVKAVEEVPSVEVELVNLIVDSDELSSDKMEEIDNALTEKSNLPVAEFFCENNKVALYEGDSEVFTCV